MKKLVSLVSLFCLATLYGNKKEHIRGKYPDTYKACEDYHNKKKATVAAYVLTKVILQKTVPASRRKKIAYGTLRRLRQHAPSEIEREILRSQAAANYEIYDNLGNSGICVIL